MSLSIVLIGSMAHAAQAKLPGKPRIVPGNPTTEIRLAEIAPALQAPAPLQPASQASPKAIVTGMLATGSDGQMVSAKTISRLSPHELERFLDRLMDGAPFDGNAIGTDSVAPASAQEKVEEISFVRLKSGQDSTASLFSFRGDRFKMDAVLGETSDDGPDLLALNLEYMDHAGRLVRAGRNDVKSYSGYGSAIVEIGRYPQARRIDLKYPDGVHEIDPDLGPYYFESSPIRIIGHPAGRPLLRETLPRLMPEIARVGRHVIDAYPPARSAVIGVGRAASPILAYLETLHPGYTAQLPLSNARLTYEQLRPKRAAAIREHLRRMLPPPSQLNGKTILLLDYASSGENIRGAASYLKRFIELDGPRLGYSGVEVELLALGTGDYDRPYPYIRVSDALYLALTGRAFDYYAQFGKWSSFDALPGEFVRQPKHRILMDLMRAEVRRAIP